MAFQTHTRWSAVLTRTRSGTSGTPLLILRPSTMLPRKLFDSMSLSGVHSVDRYLRDEGLCSEALQSAATAWLEFLVDDFGLSSSRSPQSLPTTR